MAAHARFLGARVGRGTPRAPRREVPAPLRALLARALRLAHLPNTVIPYPAYRHDADFAYAHGLTPAGLRGRCVARGADTRFVQTALFVARRQRGARCGTARVSARTPRSNNSARTRFERGPGTTREILKRLAAPSDLRRRRSVRATVSSPPRSAPPASRLAAAAEKTRIKPLRPLVHALRWRKSRAEIHAMRLSVEADITGFHAAMRVSAPGIAERDAAAEHDRGG